MSGTALATRDATTNSVVVQVRNKKGEMVDVSIPAEIAEAYPALGSMDDIAELAAEVFGGESEDGSIPLSIGDLTRVTVPDGKSKAYTVGEDAVKTFSGIVVARQVGRKLWVLPIDESPNTPPDCQSRDGVIGHGIYGAGYEENPTGECSTCPFGQFNDVNGKRVPPACKQHESWLVITEGQYFPLLVTVPPTSLKTAKKYWKNTLFMANKSLPQVVTEFGLTPAKSESGQAYNEMSFTMEADLGKAIKPATLALGEAYRAILLRAPVNQSQQAVEGVSIDDVPPVDEAPVDEAPVDEAPVDEAPVDEVAVAS